jgi:hypothetical protein
LRSLRDLTKFSKYAVVVLCCWQSFTAARAADDLAADDLAADDLAADDLAADDLALGKQTAEVQRQMEAATKIYSHFATGHIIANRSSERQWPEKMIAQQVKLLSELRNWSKQPLSLRELVSHPDPKVRTLVLGALYIREDPHELPLIASLSKDKAATFKHAHDCLSSGGFNGDLALIETPQRVRDVARAMLAPYLRSANVDENTKFAKYWNERKNRESCASWFLVKVMRATRNTTLRPEFRADIQAVLKPVKALPPKERAWTQVFLRCMSFTNIDPDLSDEECVAALKEIGPDQLVAFLNRERVVDDPDLCFDVLDIPSGRVYSWMAHFILHRAPQLLRPQDAPALLEIEEFQRKTNSKTLLGTSPVWAGAAAELISIRDVASANQTIAAALERFPLSHTLGGRYQAKLMLSLWRINGAKRKQKIADWLYLAQAKVVAEKSDESNHGAIDLLRGIVAAVRSNTKQRPDIEQLMTVIVNDPRFDQADWPMMKSLLEIASDGLAEPLVSQTEIYSVSPSRQSPQTNDVMSQWRAMLITHYQ